MEINRLDFFMKCPNVAFSVVPRKSEGDAENWNRVWVWYGLLFWHMFGTVCRFFSTWIYLQHIARPVERNCHVNTVCPYVCPSVPLIRVFTVCMKKPWVLSYPLSTQQRLIRLGRCPGWSKSLLGTQVILLGFFSASQPPILGIPDF